MHEEPVFPFDIQSTYNGQKSHFVNTSWLVTLFGDGMVVLQVHDKPCPKYIICTFGKILMQCIFDKSTHFSGNV